MEFKVETKYKNSSGVYSILNNITGKCYVGSAIDFWDRFMFHKWQLKNNRHDNDHLQKSYNKYGDCEFSFNLLELLSPKDNLIEREQFYIDLLEAVNPELGYNLSPTAGSSFGTKRTQASKDKVSTTNGRKVFQYSKDGALINIYDSAYIAARLCGLKKSVIKSACYGHKKTYGGFIWKYDPKKEPKVGGVPKGSLIPKEVIEKRLKSQGVKRIIHLSPEGLAVSIYDSVYHACLATGFKKCSIRNVLRGHRKSIFLNVFQYE